MSTFSKHATQISRNNSLDSQGKTPVDSTLFFDSSIDNIDSGTYEVKCSAFFINAPPIAFVDFLSAGVYGTQTLCKVNFTPRVNEPAFTGVSVAAGFTTVVEEIKSLLVPGTSYEPLFYYEQDTSLSPVFNGYFLEANLVAVINANNPLRFRWRSSIETPTLMSFGDLLVTKLEVSPDQQDGGCTFSSSSQ